MAVNKQVLNKRIGTVARHATQTAVPADVPSRQRQQLATAFRTVAHGVGPEIAYQRTRQWYGSGGSGQDQTPV